MPPAAGEPERADLEAEARAEFLLRLRARGLRDLAVLRAIETVPREMFVPHRYVDLANRDLALPIPCGQTMPEPFIAAQIAEAARLTPSCRVLEIGTGSGYTTAILSRLAGSVVSIERFQTLAIAARERLQGLGFANVSVVWGDGLAVTAEIGLFDRIIVHARLDDIPPALMAAVAVDGALLVAQARDGATVFNRLTRMLNGAWQAETLFACRLQPLISGLSRSL